MRKRYWTLDSLCCKVGDDVSLTKFLNLSAAVRNYCHSLPTDTEPLRIRRKKKERGWITRGPGDIVTASSFFLQVYGRERSTDLIILMYLRRHLYVINFSLPLLPFAFRLKPLFLCFSLRFLFVFHAP